MSEEKRSVLPFVFMILWFVLLLLGTGMLFLVGLMFGSEAYRGEPMPIIEWVMIAGPFAVTAILLLAMIKLWDVGRGDLAFAITCLSMVLAIVFLLLSSGALV